MLWKLKQRQLAWLAQEKGTIHKDWGGKLRIAIAFPNRYAVGMSNLGFQSVYRTFNGFPDVLCERVFYPEPEDLELIRRNPGQLISVESQRPISDFHILAFSLPFENDYSQAVEMLSFAGIPAIAEQRGESHPLVASGGIAVLLNPEPMAPFMDFFFIGEAEAILPDFWDSWYNWKDSGMSRRELLLELARQIQGIYVPSLYRMRYGHEGTLEAVEPLQVEGVPERIIYRRADLSQASPCRTLITTPNTEFSDSTLIEIGRGCGRGCRFCAAGFVYRPVRFHSADAVLNTDTPMPDEVQRIGLVSAAVSDHPEVTEICETLLRRGASLSFSSLRADTLSPAVLSALTASGHRSVAMAPEAGSERLRRVINKNITEEQIVHAAEQIIEAGILQLKLYFMIGLPTETMDDLEAIVDMAKRIKHQVLKMSRGKRRLGSIVLSVNAFVPKAFTPFQWVPFAGVRVLKERARWIQNALRKVPNIRVHFDLPKWSHVQALLARGDRRVASFLEKVAVGGRSWQQALREAPINSDFWVMRERGRDEFFPWEISDHGIKRAFLWEEYRRAMEGKTSPPCRPETDCVRCGVCLG